MKKVFRVRDRIFWACNGQAIRDVAFIEWGQKDTYWMKRLSHPKMIRIEFVDLPADRCRHCGEKP